MCSISLSRGFCSPLFLYLLYHIPDNLSIENAKKIAQNRGDVFVHNDERKGVAELVKAGNSGNLNEL